MWESMDQKTPIKDTFLQIDCNGCVTKNGA